MKGPIKIPILAVEDDPELRCLLKTILDETVFSVTVADTLRAATHALANSQAFRLVLCDLTLPDSDPEETIPAMIQMAKGIPVVAMTGWTDDRSLAMIRKQGALDVFEKGGTCWCTELVPFLNRALGLGI